MLPRVAIVDPELAHSLPPALTASTGLDALTQLIEPYVCTRANPMTDNFCLDGIRHASASLLPAFKNGEDREARTGMAWASLLGGLALANAGLGVVHGFAAPIEAACSTPRTEPSALQFFPPVLRANIQCSSRRRPTKPRARALSRHCPHHDGRSRSDSGRCRALGAIARLPALYPVACGLRGYARTTSRRSSEKAARASSMKANPVALTPARLAQVIENSL